MVIKHSVMMEEDMLEHIRDYEPIPSPRWTQSRVQSVMVMAASSALATSATRRYWSIQRQWRSSHNGTRRSGRSDTFRIWERLVGPAPSSVIVAWTRVSYWHTKQNEDTWGAARELPRMCPAVPGCKKRKIQALVKDCTGTGTTSSHWFDN